MLRGNVLARIDEKGRLKLPATIRSIVEAQYGAEFFVTSLRGESVRIYPMKVWASIEERLGRASSLDPSVVRFKSAVNYYGQSAAMDPQGRILVHPLLREKAEARGEVCVIGMNDFLEVWNHARLLSRMDEDPLRDEDLAVLGRMGL